MRLQLSLVVLALCAACAVAQPAPAFPATSSQSGSLDECRLDMLFLSGGITLNGGFSSGTFAYTCGCRDWSGVGYGQTNPTLTAHTINSGPYVQVWFNSNPVNTVTKGNELSNTAGSTSNPLATATHDWQNGDNIIQVLVTGSGCEYQYTISCYRPPDQGGSVSGDPQFVGLRGQNFQVHGVSGEIYNIVSDPDLQYNSRFVFLDSGECPMIDGRRARNCWSHPGSYLGELGLKTSAGDRIRIVSGPAAQGFALVELNGRPLPLAPDSEPQSLRGGLGDVHFKHTHVIRIRVGNWEFEFENSDMFINQHVRVPAGEAADLRSHGLLGQTWRDQLHPGGTVKYIEGAVDDYAIKEKEIFGDSFLFNQFAAPAAAENQPLRPPQETPTSGSAMRLRSNPSKEIDVLQTLIRRKHSSETRRRPTRDYALGKF